MYMCIHIEMPKRAQDPLIKQNTLNYKGLHIMI